MEECSAKKIRQKIAIDEGYLSRIIEKFIREGLITKTPSSNDKRLHMIQLTEKGQEAFARLNENQNRLISQVTQKLSDRENAELAEMMERIQNLLTRE